MVIRGKISGYVLREEKPTETKFEFQNLSNRLLTSGITSLSSVLQVLTLSVAGDFPVGKQCTITAYSPIMPNEPREAFGVERRIRQSVGQ